MALASLAWRPVAAEPWMSPGDVVLRHDLQLLSDSGLLSGTSLGWPIGWSLVARELSALQFNTLTPAQRAAAARLRQRVVRESRTDDLRYSARLAGAVDPMPIRTFEDAPREEGEATVTADWLGQRFAVKLQATLVADPDDDETFRPDGTYVAANLGNWMISAGWVDRWWGPGWQGSLILSNNARPLPSIGLDRNEALPSDLPVLRWLGPWRFSTFMGQFESDRDYPQALLFGMRGEIRPHPTLQLAVSRTAQWCGDGRPCDLGTFWDLLIGNDNDQDPSEQPGNQLAGFDARWSWPGARVPLALYAQAIGEDEAGFMPSKYLGVFGAETWGQAGSGTWRAHVEYADTTCDFLNSAPQFGCAYTNTIYTTGYRFRGRVVGHSIDGDGQSLGAGVLYVDAKARRWEVLVRHVELNREGVSPGHSLADAPATVDDLSVTHDRAYEWGKIGISLGYASVDAEGLVVVEDGARGWLTWRREFR